MADLVFILVGAALGVGVYHVYLRKSGKLAGGSGPKGSVGGGGGGPVQK